MRVPLGWLKDYVTWDLPAEELAERLTMGGLESGPIEYIGADWDPTRIFVAQVLSIRRHPNADRLVLVTVDYGADEPLEVVTGAPNLPEGTSGQKVVFATVGARLRDPYAETLKYQTLKRSKIRGVASEGMVCSEKELGISEEHTGIIILPDDAPVGVPFADYWGDVVLDLDLTPNLARALSMVGVAREAAALAGGDLHLPEPTVRAEGPSIDGRVEIAIEDPDLCPRYSAALIEGVKVGPSPQWMQRRLILAGMRPINNIVDITNYVMWELGQPLHAFDYRLLRPKQAGGAPAIIVRRARPGEKMTTLDGVERTLTDDMLLITDGGGPVGIAGVMGGLESEVSENTIDVLLEAANFDYISIRRTSAALKLNSEAAYRFGRGVDPELTLVALRRAAELMRELAGGTVAAGLADLYPRPPAPKVIDFRVPEVKRILGIELSAQQVADMLGTLGFECEILPGDPAVVRTTVPGFRLDVSISADLLEEIARVYGYDRLPTSLMADELPPQERNMPLELEEWTRDILVGCGLTEIISYSMTNLESVARLNPEGAMPDGDDYIRLANPLSREHEYMRKTLLNTTLETVARNRRFVDHVAIFEIACVYLPREDRALPDEPRRLSIALMGPREQRSWLTNESAEMDFYDLKGVVETLCEHLGITDVSYAPADHPTFHPGRTAELIVGGEPIGVFGEVHPRVRENFDLPDERVCLLELDLEALLDAAQPVRHYEPISRMPALKLALAVVVDKSVPSDAVGEPIRNTGGALLVDVVLFDVYRGEQLGVGKKSLAYSLTFQAPDKTLTTEEAMKQRERIIKQLQQQYDAGVRA